MIRNIFSLTIFCTFIFYSCEEPTPPNEESTFAAAFTDDPEIPVIGIHEEGEMISVITGGEENEVIAAIYTSQDGKTFIVWIGDNGYPEKAYSEGYTFLFDNYNNNTVDIASITPDGDIEILREINIDFSSLMPSMPILSYPENGSSNISTSVSLEWNESSNAVPQVGYISISIYDMLGREIANLYNGSHMPGYHIITWDASDHASGIYFVKMIAGEYVNTQKIMLVK